MNRQAPALTPETSFEYGGWQVHIEMTASGDAFSGHANLFLGGQPKCRLILASGRIDQPSARLALETKARRYIDDWNAAQTHHR